MATGVYLCRIGAGGGARSWEHSDVRATRHVIHWPFCVSQFPAEQRGCRQMGQQYVSCPLCHSGAVSTNCHVHSVCVTGSALTAMSTLCVSQGQHCHVHSVCHTVSTNCHSYSVCVTGSALTVMSTLCMSQGQH